MPKGGVGLNIQKKIYRLMFVNILMCCVFIAIGYLLYLLMFEENHPKRPKSTFPFAAQLLVHQTNMEVAHSGMEMYGGERTSSNYCTLNNLCNIAYSLS